MDIKGISNSLIQAEKNKQPIAPLTNTHPEINTKQAYNIQLELVNHKIQEGNKIVGKKIGLTSKAMQELLNVDQPDYGHIFDNMVYDEKHPVATKSFIEPRVEFEIAFVLKQDLEGPNVSVKNVVKAIDYVIPAIEIIDSRIQDWNIKFEDTVADNGSSAGAMLGKNQVDIESVDLPNVNMTVYKNGEMFDQARGEAVMGNPINAVAWLANTLSEYNISLKQGEFILAGALSKAVPAESGDTFRVSFSGLGDVNIAFE